MRGKDDEYGDSTETVKARHSAEHAHFGCLLVAGIRTAGRHVQCSAHEGGGYQSRVCSSNQTRVGGP